MKNVLKSILIMFGVTLVFLVWYAFTAGGSLMIQRYIYPEWLNVQRSAVESSKSYTDSKNTALMNLLSEEFALDTKIAEAKDDKELVAVYKSQQKAIKNQVCQMVATMKQGTVSSAVTQFISQNGGCY
jgi:hypothetical protein